jgi:hypothetical protein
MGLGEDDVLRLINCATLVDADREGRLRYTAETAGGFIRVVLAIDNPDLVVTVHERDRLL